jgi:hypothetical protein
MKIRSLFLVLIVLASALTAFGQDVSILPRRIIYKRTKPLSEDKAKIIIDYPRVKAASPRVSRRIEHAISFAEVFNLSLRREMSGEQWLESAGFFVNYNKNDILSITLSMNGTGQFYSTMERSVVVDLNTGKQATAGSVFDNLDGVRDLVYKKQQAEIEQAMIDIPKIEGYSDFDSGRWFGDSNITLLNLQEFSVSEEGVTFKYDYGFPRIMKDIQPEGNFLITWRELKPYIRRGGLLGKFVC